MLANPLKSELEKTFFAALSLIFVCVFFAISLNSCDAKEDLSAGRYNEGDDENETLPDDASLYTTSERLTGYFAEGGMLPTITYGQEKVTLEIVPGYENGYDNQLKVNGQTMELRFASIGYVQIIDGVILFATGGTDMLQTRLYAFDMNGKQLMEIFALDENGMRIFDMDNSIQIENDKIKISGSRQYHGPSLRTGGETDIALTDSNGMWSTSVPDDEIVRADYEVQYLGGGKFGEPTKTETTMTYAQFKQEYGELIGV